MFTVAQELRTSFVAAKAETVITTDQGVRGGKTINLKETVDAAVALCPGIKRVFVTQRTGAKVAMGARDIALEEVIRNTFVTVQYSYTRPI